MIGSGNGITRGVGDGGVVIDAASSVPGAVSDEAAAGVDGVVDGGAAVADGTERAEAVSGPVAAGLLAEVTGGHAPRSASARGHVAFDLGKLIASIAIEDIDSGSLRDDVAAYLEGTAARPDFARPVVLAAATSPNKGQLVRKLAAALDSDANRPLQRLAINFFHVQGREAPADVSMALARLVLRQMGWGTEADGHAHGIVNDALMAIREIGAVDAREHTMVHLLNEIRESESVRFRYRPQVMAAGLLAGALKGRHYDYNFNMAYKTLVVASDYHPDPEVRVFAVNALAVSGAKPQDIVAALSEAVHDHDLSVVTCAAINLVTLLEGESFKSLPAAEILAKQAVVTAASVVDVMKPEVMRDYLDAVENFRREALLSRESADAVIAFLSANGAMPTGDKASREAMLFWDWRVRELFVKALSRQEASALVGLRLVSFLRDPILRVRRAALSAIVRLGGSAVYAIPELLGIIEEGREELLDDCCVALGKIGRLTPANVGKLAGIMTTSQFSKSRIAAAKILRGLGKDVLNIIRVSLIQALRSPIFEVKEAAAQMLGRLDDGLSYDTLEQLQGLSSSKSRRGAHPQAAYALFGKIWPRSPER